MDTSCDPRRMAEKLLDEQVKSGKLAGELDDCRQELERLRATRAMTGRVLDILCTRISLRDPVRQDEEEDLQAIARFVRAVGAELAAERVRERDQALAQVAELRQRVAELEADRQRWILGTPHGTGCWMDDCGWHCGEGCRAAGARQCDAAAQLAGARGEAAELRGELNRQDETMQHLASRFQELKRERAEMAVRPWLVVQARETLPVDAWQFTDESQARVFYDKVSIQWSETFLCRVVAGPKMLPPSVPLHPLEAEIARLREELKAAQDELFRVNRASMNSEHAR